MKTLFILSPLSQFKVTSLIGLNAPKLGHLNLTLATKSYSTSIKPKNLNKMNLIKS
jgi:hypothetical protein